MITLFRRLIDYLENSKAPFVYFVLTFFFATNLRSYLEQFSDRDVCPIMYKLSVIPYIHFCLSYVALAMSIILLFSILTKVDIVRTAKVILPSFVILISVPIVDLILSLGHGHNIGYLTGKHYDNIPLRFFTFFGNFPGRGVTPGMRIEIGLVLIGSFIYFHIKKLNLIKCLFNVFLVYALIFFYCSSPTIIKPMFEFFGINYKYSAGLMMNFYPLIIFFIGLAILYSLNSSYFKIILRDIRPFRLVHYELMFILGLVVSLKTVPSFTITDKTVFNFIFIAISIALAWLYSVMTNNIEDYEIDKISNSDRPLMDSNIDQVVYKRLAWGCLAVSLFYAVMAHFLVFITILVFIGNYYIYSMPPIRLKRLPILSKLAISLNSLILILLGFLFANGSLYRFLPFIPLFLIGYTFAINFIDIKDYEGDKKEGIKTLPVILGLKRAKFIIGLCFAVTCFSAYFVLKNIYAAIPFSILGIILYLLINRRNYNEKPVFITYLITLVLFLFLY